MSRELIVVDIETTGLSEDAAILEVAAVNIATGELLHFVPNIGAPQMAKADPAALQINRYYERGLFRHMLSVNDTLDAYDRLRDMLAGNTVGGSNPTFDTALLAKAQYHTMQPSDDAKAAIEYSTPAPVGHVWHHRLADLAAFAAPLMCRPPWDLPGLADVCGFLGVANACPHSAQGDALAAAECFRRLAEDYAAIGLSVNEGQP